MIEILDIAFDTYILRLFKIIFVHSRSMVEKPQLLTLLI